MIGRLEGDYEKASRSVARAAEARLTRIEQATVGGPQAALDDRPCSTPGIPEPLELERRRSSEAGPVLQSHPCLSNDAQGPLRANQQACRVGSCTGAWQSARLIRSAWSDRAHTFDEIIDVCE